MSLDAFRPNACPAPSAENGMEGFSLEKLPGAGEEACLYQSKVPTFASIQVYAADHSIQLGNGSKEKLLAALDQLLPKLK